MDDKKVTKKQHNKQHDARAASFKRIAKEIRRIAKKHGLSKQSFFFEYAMAFDEEAALLRSMR